MSCYNEVIVCTSGQVHGEDTYPIIKKIEEDKPKHFVLWQVGEFHAPQFMKLINHDFSTTNEIPLDIMKFEESLIKYGVEFFLVLGGDERSLTYKNLLNHNIKNFQVIFWPTFLLHYSYHGLNQKFGNIFQSELNENFDKLYLNLNNKARRHRCMLIDELYRNNLLDFGLTSWHGHHREYEFKYWKEEILKLDNFVYELHDTTYSEDLINFKVLFNLITESDDFYENLFFTEKTYRTILLGQPFLCLGSKNQNIGLKRFGFELYDELFDYSFDNENDLDKRITGIIDNINRLKNFNYRELFGKIKDKVIHNRNNAIKIIENDPFFPKKMLDLYTTYGNDFLNLFDYWNQDYRTNYPFANKLDLFDEIIKTKL